MGRRRWLGVAFALAAAGLGAAVGPGCFAPDRPACAFSCIDPPHACPTGFVCGDDSLCHDPTSTALCRLEVADAGDGGDGADAGAPTDARAATDLDNDHEGDRGGQGQGDDGS